MGRVQSIVPERANPMNFIQHTAAIDVRKFDDNGVVTTDEYLNIVEILRDKLNGMRVPTIRKGFELEPYTYDEYVATANANYDRAFAPITDPEFGVELNTITVVFRALIPMTMFPSFDREYFNVISLDRVSFGDQPVEVNSAGYATVPTNQYKSLLLAGLQIEQEVRSRVKQSNLMRDIGPNLTIETRFMIPLTLDMASNESMLVELQVDLYPEK